MESEIITQLAEQLGLAASNVFNIFAVAQPKLGIIGMFLLFGVITSIILIYRYTDKKTKDNTDGWEIKFIVTASATILMALIAGILYDILTRIFLPEYAAANELIRLLIP